MRLSSAQREAVGGVVSEYAVADVESPEQAAQQALDAIIAGDANPVARMVTDAAGIEWVTPSIWARKEASMNAKTAREIIAEGLSSETWEAPAPEDDDAAITDAEQLVKMAEDAWEQNIRGPEVEAILKIAASEENGDEPKAAKPKPATKAKPAAKQAAPKPGRPKPKAADPEPEAPSFEEPWENYDKDAVKEIVEGVEVWGEQNEHDALVNLYLYEQANKNRKNIIAACEAVIPAELVPAAAGEPEPDAEPKAEEVPEEWNEEPFETYDKMKVADIKDSLVEFFESEEYDEEAKLNVLGHTYHYEQSNKSRSGLIDYLDGIRAAYEEATADVDAEGAEEAAGEAEDAAASEADEAAAPRPARSKSPGKAAGSAKGARDPGDGATIYTVSADGVDDISVYSMNTAGAIVVALLSGGETNVSVIASDG